MLFMSIKSYSLFNCDVSFYYFKTILIIVDL